MSMFTNVIINVVEEFVDNILDYDLVNRCCNLYNSLFLGEVSRPWKNLSPSNHRPSNLNTQTIESEKQAFLGGYSYTLNGTELLYGTTQATINMKKCLLKHFCFKEENITFRLDLSPFEFVNNKATFLLKNLNNFISKSSKGDHLLIHLAGHGNYD